MLEALVLAGGASSRMGTNKAVLPTKDGRSFVVRVVETLRAAGLPSITLVTGQYHDAIVAACSACATPVRVVRNPSPSRGQLSSLLTGLDHVDRATTAGALVTLVDVPFVSVATVSALVAAWEQTRAPIVRPVISGRHGHPVIFDKTVFAALRSAPLDVGARAVINAYRDRIANIPVTDAGCLIDVDTPEDYERLTSRA